MQKVVISDPETGKAYSIELDEAKAKVLQGLEIGKVLDAAPLGLTGYKIEITGGSDKDGFPMRHDLKGRVRPRVLLSRGPGYKPLERGLRRRKRVRGNVITPDIVQVNAKIVKKGKKSIKALLGKEEEGAD
jgi:small subunit ribosomal protein S6e